MLLALAATCVAAAPAQADHHEISITRVEEGGPTMGSAAAEYVQLQLYSNDQDQFGPPNNVTVRLYEADGDESFSQAFTADLANPQSQRAALIATASAETLFGVQADLELTDADRLNSDGGAVCATSTPFGGLDCVSWGTFTGSLPSPAGTPFGSFWSADAFLGRSIAPGCATLLESGDDTDDSNADFSTGDLSEGLPRNNASAPTEVPCPNTTITKKPKQRTTDRTPTFKFASVPDDDAATFECKLDDEPFAPCDSPLNLDRQPRGKHKFRVAATLGGAEDPSPASYSWKIVKP